MRPRRSCRAMVINRKNRNSHSRRSRNISPLTETHTVVDHVPSPPLTENSHSSRSRNISPLTETHTVVDHVPGTLFTSSSPVDRSFVDQTELSFLISRTEVFENFVKVHFGRSITNSSYPQNNTVVLRRRTATMFRVSCPYVITRHNNDDSNRSCFVTLALRVRYIMTTDL